MRRLADLSGLLSLKWTQSSVLQLAFELREVDEVVATLTVRDDWSFASAETAEGTWNFERDGGWRTKLGLWRPKFTVRGADPSLLASCRGDELTLADGRVWRVSDDFLTLDLKFRNEKDEPLVTYRTNQGLFRPSAYMAITPEGARLPELPWLAPFGWYLVAYRITGPRAGR